MVKFVTFLSVLLLLVSNVRGCSCFPANFEEQYNGALTVVKARVVLVKMSPTPKPSPCVTGSCSISISNQPVVYILQLLQIFKGCGPPFLIFFTESHLRPGYCGFGMKEGEIYMLNLYKELPRAGSFLKFFNVNSCQGNRLFSSLTSYQRQFLKSRSKKPENKCIST